ncbi:MAG: four helix bundle protein [Phycisphaerales bacterium]
MAWQRGMTVAKETYVATTHLPDSERYGLCSQMRRAAVSIPSNIAEGFGRESTVDLLRFLRMSRGSLFELQTQFRLSVDLDLLPADAVPVSIIEECDRVLQALIKSLESKAS